MGLYKIDFQDNKYDLIQMSRDELLDLKLRIDTQIDGIKVQLAEAAGYAKAEGIYADPSWYARATAAGKIMGRKSQTIQRVLSQRKRQEKAERQRTIGDAFIDAARVRLAPDTFTMVMEDAHEILAQKQYNDAVDMVRSS